jgi:hypothetical protein
MYLAVALRDRLPRVGALFMDGVISAGAVRPPPRHDLSVPELRAAR